MNFVFIMIAACLLVCVNTVPVIGQHSDEIAPSLENGHKKGDREVQEGIKIQIINKDPALFFRSIKDVKAISEIKLLRCNSDNWGFRELHDKKFDSLKLCINSCKIESQNLLQIAGLSGLVELELVHVYGFTSEDFLVLKDAKSLRSLTMENFKGALKCSEQLRKLLPKLSVSIIYRDLEVIEEGIKIGQANLESVSIGKRPVSGKNDRPESE